MVSEGSLECAASTECGRIETSRTPLWRRSGTVLVEYLSESSETRIEFREVCCAVDSCVDRTFLAEVSLVPLLRIFFERCIMNKFHGNSVQIFASRKECYGQKNRSAQ